MTVGPTKVNARKSILFNEGTPVVKIKKTCLIQLAHYKSLKLGHVVAHYVVIIIIIIKHLIFFCYNFFRA